MGLYCFIQDIYVRFEHNALFFVNRECNGFYFTFAVLLCCALFFKTYKSVTEEKSSEEYL